MTLTLDPFQAPLPYPKVRGVRPDKKLAALLMEGYCGEISELTTVTQYNYHSLCCRSRYGEVSRVMRGIFHVETLHLEYLGNCVEQLGGDPRYLLSLREQRISWQGALVAYEESPAKMLLADLTGEKAAVEYYDQMATAAASQPGIAALMERLAEDERLHVRMLTDLYRKTFRR